MVRPPLQLTDPFILFSSLQFYLPDESVINKDHLKDVLVGKKQFFKKQAVT